MHINYNGIAISEKIPNGRTSGVITIGYKGFEFRSDKGEVTFPVAGLKIEAGGASGKLLFFTHPSKKGWSVYTDDKSILKNEFLAGSAELSHQLSHFRKKDGKSRMAIGAGLAVFVVSLYLIYLGLSSGKDYAIRKIAEKIPVEWEEKLGNLAISGAALNTIKDPALDRDLQKIISPLMKQVEKDNKRKYNFRFHLVSDSQVNAFALPGGIVMINAGLVQKSESPEELIGVIAHEISHVTRQHGVRQIIQTLGMYMIIQTLLGDVQGVLAILLDNSGFLMNLKFSRDFEREADDSGFKYLVEAGINPSGMVSFFKKLHEEEKKVIGEGGDYLSIISTHPATEERIGLLSAKLKKFKGNNNFIKFNVDYSKFKNKVKHAK